MSLEVRIPISPRADYFNRVRLIAHSIREFYPDALVRVSVGADEPPYRIEDRLTWSKGLGIEWVWVPRSEYLAWRGTAHEYIATMMERFKPPFTAKYVLMIDADVLVIERFDELFTANCPVSAVMAHGSPFVERHVAGWEALYRDFQLGPPAFEHEHSGWGSMVFDPTVRFSPPYFNTGVVFGSAANFAALYAPYMLALQFVRDRHNTYYFEQIALTLAATRAAVPLAILPARYNYPNQIEFDKMQARELLEVRLLHFLRTDIVGRERDFETLGAMRALTARSDLRGSNELLRQRVARLMERFES